MKSLFIFFIAFAAALFLYWYSPQSTGAFLKCPFLDITGLYCPGCGSMRCCKSLLHGRIIQALDFNPFTFLAIPFLAFAYIRFAVREIWKKELKYIVVKPVYIWGLLIFIIVFWIIRNLPWFPFTVLAP